MSNLSKSIKLSAMAMTAVAMAGSTVAFADANPKSASATHPTTTTSSMMIAPTASPIKHVVVIFQENRSFDNYFGTYPNASGFQALPGTPAVNGIPADSYNLDASGKKITPYTFSPSELRTADVDHAYGDMIASYDNGKMDKFVIESEKHKAGSGPIAMGNYDYQSIPSYWDYAQHFAMADNWFQPIFGPSTPGALYLVAARSGTLQADGTTSLPAGNDIPPLDGPQGGDASWAKSSIMPNRLTYPNIGDELTSKDVSWGWYQGGYAAGDANYSSHHNPFQYFANYANGSYKNNLKDYTNFASDVTSGTLPAVSFVKASYPEDEHPGYSDPSGENFAVETVNDIMNSPYWKNTAIIITYDESGGYWDHVAPPQVSPGPDGLQGDGPRIPAIVISPYAKRNYVSHVQYDTTSILHFIEWNWGVGALNNRDANAANLTDFFNFKKPDNSKFVISGAAAPVAKGTVAASVKVNNFDAASTGTDAPFIANGQLYMSVADFARNFNIQLKQNGHQVWFAWNGTMVSMPEHGHQAQVDMQSVNLGANMMTKGGSLFVPVNNLAKALGIQVSMSGSQAHLVATN